MMSDQLLFILVVAGIALVIAIRVIEKALNWYRARRDVKKLFSGDIPVEYEKAVKTAQAQVNSSDQRDDKDARLFTRLQDVRESVAHVRYAGYLKGESDQLLGRPFEQGVTACPHRKKTGASRQWVRGYCMARNVIDPKPYMDDA